MIDIDTALLRLLNREWATPFLDRLIPIFSKVNYWRLPIILLLIAIIIRYRLWGLSIAAGLGLCILLGEGASTLVVKELVDRVRPCHIYEWVRLIEGYCPKSPSFPSSHATNIMAAALFISLSLRRWPFFALGGVIATLVGYSRIYLGVHYPLDVIGGWVVGGCCALAISWLHRLGTRRWFQEGFPR